MSVTCGHMVSADWYSGCEIGRGYKFTAGIIFLWCRQVVSVMLELSVNLWINEVIHHRHDDVSFRQQKIQSQTARAIDTTASRILLITALND